MIRRKFYLKYGVPNDQKIFIGENLNDASDLIESPEFILFDVEFYVDDESREAIKDKRVDPHTHAWVIGTVLDDIPRRAMFVKAFYNPYYTKRFESRPEGSEFIFSHTRAEYAILMRSGLWVSLTAKLHNGRELLGLGR